MRNQYPNLFLYQKSHFPNPYPLRLSGVQAPQKKINTQKELYGLDCEPVGIDAGIAYYSFNTSAFELPFEATENRKLYKLYMVDTGLLGSILLKGIQFQVLNGDISVNEGALTENYVACALSAKGISLHYYDKNSKQELDFIIEEQNKITVIEVKSGEKYKKHASLDAAVKDYTDKIHRSIVLSRYNVSRKDDVLYLPLYMTIFI